MLNDMKIRCVWEHNGGSGLLYAENYIGAFARGESREIAVSKMAKEVRGYVRWAGMELFSDGEIEIVQEKSSELRICDADSDVIFESEKAQMTEKEYWELKRLALRSAKDFHMLYEAVPDKGKTCLEARKTFYGDVPRTAEEMYLHTKNVNEYYFAEIGINADNFGTILDCRARGFEALEQTEDFLKNEIFDGSYGEKWTLRKLLRRFIWHDRIHAKAMYRMALKTFGEGSVPDIFGFEVE